MMPGSPAVGLVVELCADDVAGSYCARMLHSVGLEVVKVESGTGDPLRAAPPRLAGGRSALFEYLNAGKRSVVADISTDAGWAFVEPLIRRADVVVMATNGDVDTVQALQQRVAAVHPSCIRVVTSGFGLTGPYRNLIRTDLIDWATSGYMYVTGQPDREPLSGGGPFPAYTTGLTAAVGALAAWRDVRSGAPGRLVDVSTIESMAALHQWTLTQYSYTGWIKQRVGDRHGEMHHPVAFLECSDGWVCVAAAGAVQWERLELVIGALIVALVVGGAIGIWAAIHYQDPAGRIALGATGLGVSVPDFWLATIASGVFGLTLKWVPAVGYAPLSQGIGANLKSIIVPILVLSLASGALFARHLQSSMVAALRSPYVRTAWAMGLKPRRVYWTYAIRNSLGPTITFLPLVVASLVGASVIVEIVFAINGVSSEIVQSITNRDYTVLQAVVLLLALTVVVLNFLADLALAFIDPRTRRASGR